MTTRTVVEEIADIRRRLGPPPRSPSSRLLRRHRESPPKWLEGGDPLQACYRSLDQLLRNGRVVWARTVLANRELFSHGFRSDFPPGEPLPATVVYSTDPSWDGRVERLEDVMKDLHRQPHEALVEDPTLAALRRAVAEKDLTVFHQPLPDQLGSKLFYTSLIVHPKTLPARRLGLPFFPLLVAPGATRGAVIVHPAYWSRHLRLIWRKAELTRDEDSR